MGDAGCKDVVSMLNFLFEPAVLRREGPGIAEKLTAGETLSEVLVGLGKKFARFKRDARVLTVESVIENWPASHQEPVKNLVLWAIARVTSGEQFRVEWKGDAEHDETVLRLELKEDSMSIEFAHPPFVQQRMTA